MSVIDFNGESTAINNENPAEMPSELNEGSTEPIPNSRSNEYMRRVNEAKLWYLIIDETISSGELVEGDRITGQFMPEGVNITQKLNIPEAGGYGRTHPIIQWIGGSAEEISFKARLFSEVRDDNTAEFKYAKLRLLTQSHAPFNRPPLTRFFWGNAIPGGMSCLISDLSATLDEIREDGSQRGMVVNIRLRKYTEFTIDRTSQSSMERTPIHVVHDGETYEMIAQKRYGNPLLGVSLRQQNPRYPMKKWAPKSYADLSAGEIIKLYPVNDLKRVKPESHILSDDNQVSLDNKRYYFTLRSYKFGTYPKR